MSVLLIMLILVHLTENKELEEGTSSVLSCALTYMSETISQDSLANVKENCNLCIDILEDKSESRQMILEIMEGSMNCTNSSSTSNQGKA